jgi:hypothetical protein
VRVGEGGTLGGYDEVAAQGDLETAGDAGAVDGGKDWLADGADSVAGVAAGARRVGRGLEVDSGAEGRIGARDDHDPHLARRVGRLELPQEASAQRPVERVPHLGPVEREDSRRALGRDEETRGRGVGHHMPPLAEQN